jgi:AhpD family alkylhydroperoxidase
MEDRDRDHIEQIIADRKYAHGFYTQHSDVYRSFIELERKTYSDGSLTKAQKELIATGISVVTDCESCMEWHVNEALKSGATPAQVIEAVGVGIEMGGGRATVSARFAMKVLQYYAGEPTPGIRGTAAAQ